MSFRITTEALRNLVVSGDLDYPGSMTDTELLAAFDRWLSGEREAVVPTSEESRHEEYEAVRNAAVKVLGYGVSSQSISFNRRFLDALHDTGWKVVRNVDH